VIDLTGLFMNNIFESEFSEFENFQNLKPHKSI